MKKRRKKSKAWALREYEKGRFTLKQIGTQTGTSATTVWKWAKKAELPPRGQGTRPDSIDREKAVKLYRKGLSTAEVGKELGCSHQGILRLLKVMNEPRRARAVAIRQACEKRNARDQVYQRAKKKALRMYKAGKPILDIVALPKVNHRVLYRWIREAELHRRLPRA